MAAEQKIVRVRRRYNQWVVNETLERNGLLTDADLDQIYETYLSHIKNQHSRWKEE